jgi:hypothetical protein
MVALTSLTRAAFGNLLAKFKSYINFRTGSAGGRPTRLQYHHQALGLILVFYFDAIGAKNLFQIFALTSITGRSSLAGMSKDRTVDYFCL